MSEKLFNSVGVVNGFFSRQSWITKPVYYLLDLWVPNAPNSALAWGEEADIAMLEQTPAGAKKLLYVIAFILLVAIIWACFAHVDELTRGEGRVIPARQVQIVQSLDGGIVSQILVAEGQTVKTGDALVRIDETRVASTLRENQSQYLALLAKQARLKALAEGGSFNPPPEVQKESPLIYNQELALYQSSKDELASAVSIGREQVSQRENELVEVRSRKEFAEKSYDSSAKELAANRPLLASGAVSEIDILRLEREATKARGEIDQSKAQIARIQNAITEANRKVSESEQVFRSKVRTELNDNTAKLNSLTETSVALTDKVKQATVKSPVNGKVSRLFFNTVGGVIQPGKEILEIVPSDDALVIETKIQIKDIAFMRVSQHAVVKLTAYDYTIYGTLDGIVEDISPNSIVDDKGNAYYIIKVRTLKSSLGKNLPIIPGMVAQVDVITGNKTVLSYLLKPVLKAKSYAFSER